MQIVPPVRLDRVLSPLLLALLLAAPAAFGQGTASIYTDNFGVPDCGAQQN